MDLISSYAYSYHNDTHQSEFCGGINHFHVILEVPKDTKLPYEVLSIPCLYTCYKQLVSNMEKRTLSGDVFCKLQSAVLLNKTTHYDKMTASTVRKLLPRFKEVSLCKTANGKSLKRKEVQTQTDLLNSGTLMRFQKLCKGPNSAPLLMIMDIMESGYGSYDHKHRDSHLQFSLTTNTLTTQN